ncbi:MAG TPA: hypothetical protein VFZ53_27295 [Polyangiaceae bacterium]
MRRALLLPLLALACSTYREDLNRGQRLYEENQYDRALAIWRVLEDDVDSLTPNDQARYAYLRGMTNYRLGYRPYARHWLGVARSIEKEHPGGLNQEWKDRLAKSLEDLDKDVYGGGEGFGEKSGDAADAGAAEATPPSSP